MKGIDGLAEEVDMARASASKCLCFAVLCSDHETWAFWRVSVWSGDLQLFYYLQAENKYVRRRREMKQN